MSVSKSSLERVNCVCEQEHTCVAAVGLQALALEADIMSLSLCVHKVTGTKLNLAVSF